MKKRVLSLMLASSLILSCMSADLVFAAETTQGDEITSEEVSEEQEKIEVSESEEVQQGYESPEETYEMEEEAGQKQKEEEENSTETDPAANIESETQDVQRIENEGKENGEHSSEANLGEDIDEEQGIDQKAGVSVAAASQDYGDLSEYDVYLANQLINYGRYDFMTQEYQSACEIYVRSGKENGLSSEIAAWRALTFDGASEVGYAQAEVGYYEAILFDLVYDEEGGGVENAIYNNIMDASEAVKASNWKKICEGGEEALMNMPVSEDNLEAVYSVVQKCDSLQGILDKIGNVTDILGYVDSGKDFLDKLSELSVLVSVSDETQEIITDLAESYNKVDAMNAALDEYAHLFTDLMDETTILSYLAGRTTLEELSKEWAGGIWKSVITKMNSAGLAVEVGQTIGKMASNFLVSTDGIIETFYSMEAMTKFTELLTSQVRTYGERFKSNPSVENAKKFNAAFELLYKAHVINLDYAEDFLNQVKTEGFINWLFQGTEDENYQENLRSINNMKEDFSTYIDTKKAITLSLYQEEYPSNIDTGLKDVEVKIPVSDEQLAVIETEIESVSERISDLTFSEDKTFNADVVHYGNITLKNGTLDLNGYNMTVYGDLYIQGGLLRLSGGHLTINGNVYHSGGMLYLSEGTFETNENYWLGSENTDGTINTSSGEIKMDAESDYLRVTGDFYMYSRYGSNIQWTEGTTEIGGNLYKYHDNISHTGISEEHKIIFTGEKDVVISSEGYKQLNLANVKILNSTHRIVILSGDIGISGSLTADSEELKISAQDAVLSGDGFSNVKLVVDSDLTYDSGTWSLNGKSLQVKGDMHQNGGTLNLEKGSMTVAGSYYHQNGMLNLSGGTAEIKGTYYLGMKKTDGTINTSDGDIRMSDESDLLKVAGDFYMYSHYGSSIQWTEGTTEIGGNLYKYHDDVNSTGISEKHKIIFTGEKDVVISSEGYKQLNLANVKILNSTDRIVMLRGDIGISGSLTADSEELKISAQDAVLSGDGFSNVKLVVDSDLTYDSGTWSLDGKSLQVKGDMYQDGGNLNLETGNIIVDGSYYHQNGMLNLSGGTMEIGGTYYLGLKEKDGSIKISNGTIKMENASDLLKVAGDFYMYSRAGSDIQWTEGVTEIGGNLYKYHEDINSTRISGNHKTVFTGKKDVVISSQGYKQLNFANVEILNAGSRKVTLEGDIDISESLTCDSEELTLYTQNAVLSGNGFSDVNLNIDSDITYDGGTWSLSGKKLQIKGNMYQNGGILKLMGGTLEIGGTYYLGMKEPDGTIHTSGGEIRMIDESDLLKVAGDIYLYSDFGSNIQWTEGTTEIGGNLYKYHYYNTNNTGISGNHKMRFTGEKDLIISSKGERQLDLANVEILNAADRKVTMEGDIGISGSLTCDNEKLTISAQEAVLSGNGFSNLNLIVDSNLTYDSGTWLLNGKKLQVNGDVYQKGGILNLGKGSLTVSGSYNHQGGTLNPSGGSVDIGENYYNAVPGIDSSSGDPVYDTSSGLLYMNNPASFMNVAGDFVVASSQSHSDKLTAGTIAIQGDFTQISGNAYNFACDEDMTVILNGKDVQYVSFASPNSKFNILQLTKDKDTGYVFSPGSCWNELEEVRDEFAILVQPEDCAAAEGGQAVFTVKASGDELSYQWQYCEPEGDEWKDVEQVESMSDTLTIPVTEDIDGQKYRCIVKNGEGESLTTEEAVLNVKYELTILQQPENFIGKAGDTAIFSVMAAGYQVSYQWQYQNAGSDEWRNSSMAGSSSSTLVVSVNSSRDGQKYRCVLTDGDGKRLVTDAVSIQIKEENPFTDVAQGQYYYDSILWAYENGIASGLSENEFAPDAQCTRAQVVIFLWRAKGQPKASLQELPFEDVEKGTYYYDAVAWAYENNIVSGVDGTHFGPDDPVSRGQFVTFLYRTEGKPGYTSENPFTDVAQWAYYYDPVLWAYEKGIASGLSEDTFGPDESCTRGQVVTFLYRAYN